MFKYKFFLTPIRRYPELKPPASRESGTFAKTDSMHQSLIPLLEILGTLSFAISGIRHASAKNFDWFGAYVIGFITAIGGGTVRDVLLRVPPVWMKDASFLVITLAAFLLMLLFGKWIKQLPVTLFLFDAIGLGLFTMVGLEKTLSMGYGFWVAIIMGTISGCVGGIIRDVLVLQPPLIFRKDFYAMACILGGLLYYGLRYMGLDAALCSIGGALAIIVLRIVAVRLNLNMPAMRGD